MKWFRRVAIVIAACAVAYMAMFIIGILFAALSPTMSHVSLSSDMRRVQRMNHILGLAFMEYVKRNGTIPQDIKELLPLVEPRAEMPGLRESLHEYSYVGRQDKAHLQPDTPVLWESDGRYVGQGAYFVVYADGTHTYVNMNEYRRASQQVPSNTAE